MTQTNQRVYLCYCTNPDKNKLLVCRKFETYEFANNYKKKFLSNNLQTNIVFKTVTICKHIPYYLVPWVIKWKLSLNTYGIKIY